MDYGLLLLLWIIIVYLSIIIVYLWIMNDYYNIYIYIYRVSRCIQALSSMKSNSGASFSILWPSNLASYSPPPLSQGACCR